MQLLLVQKVAPVQIAVHNKYIEHQWCSNHLFSCWLVKTLFVRSRPVDWSLYNDCKNPTCWLVWNIVVKNPACWLVIIYIYCFPITRLADWSRHIILNGFFPCSFIASGIEIRLFYIYVVFFGLFSPLSRVSLVTPLYRPFIVLNPMGG